MEQQDPYLNFNVNTSFKGFQDEEQDGWKDEWAEPQLQTTEVAVEETNYNSEELRTSVENPEPSLSPETAAETHLGLAGIETNQETQAVDDVELKIEIKSPKRKSNASYRQSLGVKFESGEI